jgi:uncharacterized protein (TIGR02217 family)
MSLATFPALSGLEYPVVRTPIFKTLTQETASGMETRAALQLYPRWQWTLSFNFLRDDANDEFRTLLAFFLARQGSFDAFQFEDIDDNAVQAQAIGIGDGSNQVFQLIRTFGGFTEPVLAPKLAPGEVVIKVGGVALDPSTDWHYSGPGEVTIASPPGNHVSVTADINYRWPVRFAADQYDFAKFMNRLWEQKKLDFISVKNL